jgi:hypothetical protein
MPLWGSSLARPGEAVPGRLAPVLAQDAAEVERQREIIAARRAHEGRGQEHLTRRLHRFLGDEAQLFGPRLNYTQKINRSLAARLVVEAVWSTAQSKDERDRQGAWANQIWGWNGGGSYMAQRRPHLHTQLVRDGEAFLLVDYDERRGQARFTPHERYTDAGTALEGQCGDGQGIRLIYPDGDTMAEPILGAKRWTAHANGPDGLLLSEPPLTLYEPGTVSRWSRSGCEWQLKEEVPWTRDGTPQGEPLGIPIVHLRTPEMRPAAREALPVQKALNKLFLDMLAASDFDAWRLLVAFGWEPPADIEPGSIIGSTRSPSEAGITSIEPGDPSRQLALIDKAISLMSDISNVPLTLIQRSGQRAAEGTLQEEKDDFIKLVQDYAAPLAAGYSEAFSYGRKLENVFGLPTGGDFDESGGFEIKWADFWSRSTAEKLQETQAMTLAGFPQSEIWRDVWGKSAGDIVRLQSNAA